MEKFKYIIIEQLLNEGRKEDAMKKYPNVPDYVVNALSEMDPSGNNKYLIWLTGQIDKLITNLTQAGDNLGDNMLSVPIFKSFLDDLKENILCFHTNLERISSKNVDQMISKIKEVTNDDTSKIKSNPKDINSYLSLGHLIGVCEFFEEMKPKTASRIKIYEDSRWLVVTPLSHKASCSYGTHSNWCVSTSNPRYFENYSSSGFLIFFIDKEGTNPKKPEANVYKVAVHIKYEDANNITEWDWYDMEDHRTDAILMLNFLPKNLIKVAQNYVKEVMDSINESFGFDLEYLTLNTLALNYEEVGTRKTYKMFFNIDNISIDSGSIKNMTNFLKIELEKQVGLELAEKHIGSINGGIEYSIKSGLPWLEISLDAKPFKKPEVRSGVNKINYSSLGNTIERLRGEGTKETETEILAPISSVREVFSNIFGQWGVYSQPEKILKTYCDLFNQKNIKLSDKMVSTDDLKVGDVIEIERGYRQPGSTAKVVRVAEKSILLDNGKRLARSSTNRKALILNKTLKVVDDTEG